MNVYRRRSILLGGLVCGGVFLVCAVRMWNNHLIHGDELRAMQNDMLQRLSLLVRSARDFDETTILESRGPNPKNGFIYRFDDHIRDADQLFGKERGEGAGAEPLEFGFDMQQNPFLQPHFGEFEVRDGILSYSHEENNYLESSPDLFLVKEQYGVLLMRLRAHHTPGMIVGWSTFKGVNPRDPFRVNSLTVWIIPDGRFHTYRVELGSYMKGGDRTDAPIRTLFIYPSENISDDIDVEYVRFLPKAARYAEHPVGVAYETRQREMRRCMYLQTESSIRFHLQLPSRPVALDFGLSSLLDEEEYGCRIEIQHGSGAEVLFAGECEGRAEWSDHTIDMTPYAGNTVYITIAATGSADNVIFLSNPMLSSPPVSRFNVIVILEDALRADRVSCYGKHSDFSPIKDRLAREGVIFTNAISQATHTRSSCASFMTSLYPSATGVWNSFDVLDDRYLTLAEIMRDDGFATASFIQNVNAGPAVGLHQGFETIFDRETIGNRAGFLYNRPPLRTWMQENADRNFFLYLHLFDPHAPYGPPIPPGSLAGTVNEIFSTDVNTLERDVMYDPSWIENPSVESRNFLYDEDVRYNDIQLEVLLGILEEQDLMRNTLLIFMSDHGEYLGEHSLWGHWPPGYRQVIHVPLIFVNRTLFPYPHEVTAPVQLVDIVPTILELTEADTTGLLLSGTSLREYLSEIDSSDHSSRLAYSEEVRFRDRGDDAGTGSLYWRDTHVLTSEQFLLSFPEKLIHLGSTHHTEAIASRVFRLTDAAQMNANPLFSFDPFFQHGMTDFHREVRSRNVSIWEAIAPSTGKDVELNVNTVKLLRQLGYIE